MVAVRSAGPVAVVSRRGRRGAVGVVGGMAVIFLDLETSGLDPSTDRILEIAAARVDGNLNPVDGFACVILPNPGIVACPPGVAYDMHSRNGLLDEIRQGQGVTLAECMRPFSEWLDRQGEGLHTLAGNSVHFDLAFLRSWCAPIAARFSHRLLDVSAFGVARAYTGLDPCPLAAGDRHRAQGDVLYSIAAARWHLSRLVP